MLSFRMHLYLKLKVRTEVKVIDMKGKGLFLEDSTTTSKNNIAMNCSPETPK